jgi:uncharacterized protein (TIGR02466 family)
MIEKFNIETIFPTPVAFIGLDREFTQEEIIFLKNVEKVTNHGNATSINSYLLEDANLANLKNEILQALRQYMDLMKYDKEIYITQSWLNYTAKGQYHHKHNHTNSFLSGVLYIETDENVDRIYFHNDIYRQISVDPTEFNILNSNSWWFPVKKHQIVIFPSYLTHSVEHKNDNNLRVSLAFNTFLKGNIGVESFLTELKL